MKRYFPFFIIAIVFLAAITAGAGLWYRTLQGAETIKSIVPGADPPHVRGSVEAPIVLEEFGDLQCPPCATLYPQLKQMESQYGDRLGVIYRHYPITKKHPYALDAARATEAAGLQNRFWEMHDWLYENQRTWSIADDARSLFIQESAALGLDAKRFTNDMDSIQVNSRIQLDLDRAKSLGVKTTPSVFINGRLVPSFTSESIRAEIDSALSSQSFER